MTGLNHRPITRLTSETDYRRRKPFVIRLERGGMLVRIKTLGSRTWFTVTVKQIYQLACETKVRLERAEKRRRREERRALRKVFSR
jgi:hypothetical protein